MARVEYKAYGKWHVTIEGGCEGRTNTDLGVHEGYIDEIAFAFSTAKEPPKPQQGPSVNSMSVSLDINSGTWDMTPEQRANYFRNLFAGRKVAVNPCQFYASVILVADEQKARELAKEKALAKLTKEEKELLGLSQGR